MKLELAMKVGLLIAVFALVNVNGLLDELPDGTYVLLIFSYFNYQYQLLCYSQGLPCASFKNLRGANAVCQRA